MFCQEIFSEFIQIFFLPELEILFLEKIFFKSYFDHSSER